MDQFEEIEATQPSAPATSDAEEEWTCEGLRLSGDGQSLHQHWRRPSGQYFTLKAPGIKGAWPGSVYRCRTEGNKVYVSGDKAPRYVRHLDGPEVNIWRAEEKAAVTQHAANRRLANLKANDPLFANLDPIREAYNKLPWHMRAAFMLAIQEYISRPARGKK